MLLYLVQHGEAKSEDEDPQRRLTPRGVQDVRKVAEFLRPLKLVVAAIWHSGKPRAQQTAEILATGVSAMQGIVEQDGLAPKDAVKPVRKIIESTNDDVMIVGHLPFLGKLAALLITGDEDEEVVAFQYSGVACLERGDDRGWKLSWMIVPDLLAAGM